VFREAHLEFSPHLNLIAGENGTGKTHLLKVIYSTIAASAEEGRKAADSLSTRTSLQTRLADKLVAVFRPESLGRLARRRQGRERCELRFEFADKRLNMDYSFATASKTEVTIEHRPAGWVEKPPVYLPTRELLTIYPGFVSVYENHYLEFEETWRDTCLLLGALLVRGPREKRVKELLEPIEQAMGGDIRLDKNGRFYLHLPGQGEMEMPLVAEGLRKLGMLARLIATGSLLDKGYLFWDEPETNLNPKLIKEVARIILHLATQDVQVFLATHSLFLLREIHILVQNSFPKAKARFFALTVGTEGVSVEQGDSIEEVGAIASLDEELAQSDRYLELA
jgi:energy-coupling factor transporter ATP-binding protein EcfA2